METFMTTQIHPETGAVLHRGRRPKTIHFGSLSKTVELEGWYPDDDGDSIHTGAELAPVEKAVRELKKRYAEHIRSSRKRWKLTQEQAGALLGGGKRAFQKYESGEAVPSYAAIALIELVNASPENLKVLRDMHGILTPSRGTMGRLNRPIGIRGKRTISAKRTENASPRRSERHKTRHERAL